MMRVLYIPLLFCIVLAPRARAQRWCASLPRDSMPYSQCSLRLDGDYLVRGMYHETIAVADLYSAIPLSLFVVGDSAMKYAGLYERDANRSGVIQSIGDLLVFAGTLTSLNQNHWPVRRPSAGTLAPAMVLSGLAIHLASVPLKWRAEQEGDRAICWNNALLQRER